MAKSLDFVARQTRVALARVPNIVDSWWRWKLDLKALRVCVVCHVNYVWASLEVGTHTKWENWMLIELIFVPKWFNRFQTKFESKSIWFHIHYWNFVRNFTAKIIFGNLDMNITPVHHTCTWRAYYVWRITRHTVNKYKLFILRFRINIFPLFCCCFMLRMRMISKQKWYVSAEFLYMRHDQQQSPANDQPPHRKSCNTGNR